MWRAILLLFPLALSACVTASEHRAAVQDPAGDKLAVGAVQREIKVGMSSAKVVEILGSPNIVTTDEERREVWVYDKFSTDVSVSASQSHASLFILGAGASSGAASTSQKTLTVIVKFDGEKRVRDFAYRTSRF
jgi:outer membrane protein assembly factor BamE (lipoprotein component of BamABCDE complex)